MSKYQDTLRFLYQQLPMYHRIGAAAYKADLSNITQICRKLGNPERKLIAVHIAGTNGKGSVSSFIASVLQEAGYKTGLFTSPHLVDFRERIRINGKLIPRKFITSFVDKQWSVFSEIKPSFFEWTTALAFDYFAKEKVDIAVIETGMGGRLDSTNILSPILSVITNISFDHTQFLGNTITQIAFEKAGIIKEKTPVIISEKHSETENVFRKVAQKNHSDIFFTEEKVNIIKSKQPNAFSTLEMLCSIDGDTYRIFSSLSGNYQKKNIPTALLSLNLLKKYGFKSSKKEIEKGVAKVSENTGIKGRWQIVKKKPLTVCDTAHNYDGIKQTIEQLYCIQPDVSKIHFVLGFVEDKDVKNILCLFPEKANFYFCQPSVQRAMKIEQLKEIVQNSIIKKSIFFKKVHTAFKRAHQTMADDDVLYIGGSTFVVGDFLKYYSKLHF